MTTWGMPSLAMMPSRESHPSSGRIHGGSSCASSTSLPTGAPNGTLTTGGLPSPALMPSPGAGLNTSGNMRPPSHGKLVALKNSKPSQEFLRPPTWTSSSVFMRRSHSVKESERAVVMRSISSTKINGRLGVTGELEEGLENILAVGQDALRRHGQKRRSRLSRNGLR
jgi:hypothetical protein